MALSQASLIVIEFGASWPRWLDPSKTGTLAVVAQHYEGAAASLSTQVRSRLARLQATNWAIENVVLVSNGRCGLEQLAARSVLTRQLLEALRKSPESRLIFTVAAEYGDKAQRQLTALARAQEPLSLGNGVSLSVRLADGSSLYERPALPGLAQTA